MVVMHISTDVLAEECDNVPAGTFADLSWVGERLELHACVAALFPMSSPAQQERAA